LDEWDHRNVQISAIYGQDGDSVSRLAEDRALPFPIYVDAERAAIRRYGVYVRINFESWNMARPSLFLINSNREIRYIYVGSNQMDWPDSPQILTLIDHEQSSD
tara:strand:+ start:10624 stop:10935 length:312 start_codon:yes stop_codon:yes gene_type:complete